MAVTASRPRGPDPPACDRQRAQKEKLAADGLAAAGATVVPGFEAKDRHTESLRPVAADGELIDPEVPT